MKYLTFFIAFAISINVFANTKVIAVLGPTINVAQYFKQLDGVPQTIQKTTPDEAYAKYYKINSKQLTPGKVAARDVNIKNLPQPIFIIGDDDKSLAWLDKYINNLKAINAIGFIVNLQSHEDYQAIVNKFHITLFPVNGDKMAQKFKVKHYPVLISKNRIEQ